MAGIDFAAEMCDGRPMLLAREGIEDEPLFAALFDRLDLSPEWTVGLLTGVLSGPETVLPSRWVPEVIGDEQFEDEADARETMGLLMHLYNEVGALVATDAEALCPSPTDLEGVEDFCGGYVTGARMHESWLADDGASVMLFVLAALAGEVEDADLQGPDDEPMADPEGWRQGHREQLAGHVNDLHRYWALRRRVGRTRVGRNDPCPCGSGKKYKKCCLP